MFYPDCSVHLFTSSDSPSGVWAVVTIMDSLDHQHIRRGRTSSSPGSISWSRLPSLSVVAVMMGDNSF